VGKNLSILIFDVSILKRIIIVIGGLIYGMLFGEGFLRIYAPVPLMPRFVTAADYGVRTNIADTDYWHWTPEAHVHMRINGQGMRSDKEFDFARENGLCRILLYGDSFFMGYEVALENSVAFLIEAYLREADVNCEVLNLSVSGFGTAEMLVALQEAGIRYQPDLVIFQWHRSDLNDNIRSGLYRLDENGLVRDGSSYLPAIEARDWLMQWGIYRWLIENSHLYSAVRTFAGRTIRDGLVNMRGLVRRWFRKGSKTSGSALAPEQVPAEVTVLDTAKHRLNAALLLEAKAVAASVGSEFLVATIPRRASRTAFHETFEEFASDLREGLHWVSPVSAFDAHADPDVLLYYEKGGGHYSILGNQIAAGVIVDYVLHRGLLDKWRQSNGSSRGKQGVEGQQ